MAKVFPVGSMLSWGAWTAGMVSAFAAVFAGLGHDGFKLFMVWFGVFAGAGALPFSALNLAATLSG